MQKNKDKLVKTRDVAFSTLHPVADQARAAARILRKSEGVQELEVISPTLLRIRYHLAGATYAEIESRLTEAGFHLANDLLRRLQHALFCYTEEIQRANLGCPKGEHNCTLKIFVNRYQRHDHGCQDNRPEHWRQYL